MEGIKRGHRVELPPLNWGATKNEGKKKKNWFNERPRATCRDVDFELSRRYLSRDRISFLGIKLCSKIRFNTSFMIAWDFGLICGDLRAISPSSFSFSLFLCRLSSRWRGKILASGCFHPRYIFFSISRGREWKNGSKGLDSEVFFLWYFPSVAFVLIRFSFIFVLSNDILLQLLLKPITFTNPRVSSGLFELFKNLIQISRYI